MLLTSDSDYLIAGDRQYNCQLNKWIGYLLKTDEDGNNLWSKNYDITDSFVNSGFREIKHTLDGNYIAVGGASSTALNKYRIYLAKFDTGGNMLWYKLLGDSSRNAEGWVVTPALDGGYLIGGSIGLNDTAYVIDFYVVKTDSLGIVQWTTYLNYWNNNYYKQVIATSDSGFILVGQREYYMERGNISLMKIDKNGNFVWNEKYNISKPFSPWDTVNTAYGVVLTDDGGYLIAGGTNGSPPDYQGIVIKVDSNRSIQWKSYVSPIIGEIVPGDSGHFYSTYLSAGIKKTIDNRYVVSGYVDYLKTNEASPYLAKIDTNGTVLWQRYYSVFANGGAGGADMQVTPDSGFILTGRARGVPDYGKPFLLKTNCLGFLGPPQAKYNKIISNNSVRFTNISDSSGEFKWSFGDGDSLGMYENPWLFDTALALYGTGPARPIDSFTHIYKDTGTYVITFMAGACGEWSILSDTIRIDSVMSGIANVRMSEYANVQISPNPFNNFLFTYTQEKLPLTFELYDVLGKKILQQKITQSKERISISTLSPGIYLYTIKGEKGKVARGKIIKQ